MADSPVSGPQDAEANFDVLVLGAGAAGLYAALSIPKHLRVGLISKDDLQHSASGWAQGGMAAAIASDDSPELHARDSLAAGAGLCEPAAVDFLVHQATAQVQQLLAMGIAFDRRGNDLALTLEAAHSRPRVLHAADTTGRELIATLTAQVRQQPNITVLANTFTLSLWINNRSGRCQGVCLLRAGQLQWLRAQVVVLATGGGGQVFAQTTNPPLSTGDGVAMAWRVGAQLRDLEFVQFHPTALTVPGAPRFLISEAVRGEGAHLIDTTGRRFVFDYDPAGELAPRDVVSRAIYLHLLQQAAAIDHVGLDLRPIPSAHVQQRFPKIIQVCRQWGVDVFQQPVPVAPAAHYWMGGVVTNLQAETSIAGLYAVGEVSSTGVHGANRLASNSLLECLVFAAQLSKLESPTTSTEPSDPSPLPATAQGIELKQWSAEIEQIKQWRQQLPIRVWQGAGICRDAASLSTALEQVQQWRHAYAGLTLSQWFRQVPIGQPLPLPSPVTEAEMRLWAETENLLDIGYLILKSAAFRQESRGGHYRRDFPQRDDENWQVHTLIQGEAWQKARLQS